MTFLPLNVSLVVPTNTEIAPQEGLKANHPLYYQSFYEVDMKPGDELSEFLDTDWVEGESDDVVRERVNQGQQTGLRQVVSF